MEDTATHVLVDHVNARDVRVRVWLAERLSPFRCRHSLGVAAMARDLAGRYGADPERAELAGLLHDVARDWAADRLVAEARVVGLDLGYLEEMAPMACLHAPLGAEVAKQEFGVDDDVRRAIAHHTMGGEDMGLLEKILFLADAIEPNRGEMPYLRELRECIFHDRAVDVADLDRACRRAYDHTFEYLLRTGQPLHPQAVRGRNWLLYQERRLASPSDLNNGDVRK